MPGVGRRLEEAPISQQQGNSIYVFTSEKGYHILQAGTSWPFPPSLAEWSPKGPLFPSSWQCSRPAGSSLDRSGRSRLCRVSYSICFSFPLTQVYSSYLGKHIWSLLRRLGPLVSEWVKKQKQNHHHHLNWEWQFTAVRENRRKLHDIWFSLAREEASSESRNSACFAPLAPMMVLLWGTPCHRL